MASLLLSAGVYLSILDKTPCLGSDAGLLRGSAVGLVQYAASSQHAAVPASRQQQLQPASRQQFQQEGSSSSGQRTGASEK